MEFKVIDLETGKEMSKEEVCDDNLLDMDLEQFAVCEDGSLILTDGCGNFSYVSKPFTLQIS